ncbi:MAG: hypothetical protein R2834_11005 [Rhodothermales bacterium]
MLTLSLGSQLAFAQPEERLVDFSRPGRPTMMVYVWGAVGQPGIWKVETDVDFLEMLTAAQVPNIGQSSSQTKEKVIIHVYRGGVSRRTEIYSSDVKKMLSEGSAYPTLQEGDIIFLESSSKQKFGLNTVLSAIGAASALVLLIIRIGNL